MYTFFQSRYFEADRLHAGNFGTQFGEGFCEGVRKLGLVFGEVKEESFGKLSPRPTHIFFPLIMLFQKSDLSTQSHYLKLEFLYF